jgi:hypothetical protein
MGEWTHSRVVHAVGDALNNPWENAAIEKVEGVLTVQYARDLLRLRGVELLEGVVDAGASARVRLHLLPFSGAEVVKEISVPIPLELAGRDVDLEVVPGYELAPEVSAPDSLAELLANESHQSFTPRSVSPHLPGFALDALRPSHSDTGPDPFMTYQRTVTPLEWFVEGRDKVRVKVRQSVR